MENKHVSDRLLTPARYTLTIAIAISLKLLAVSPVVTANPNKVSAIPDEGISGCVSFKYGTSPNPLNFTFGYACVSDMYCEVSPHGCVDEYCEQPDYSKGTRTSITTISLATRIDQIVMAPIGKDLAEHASWCLVQDGAGNFWALDKLRASKESFTPYNQSKTIIPCKTTDYFRSNLGCVAGNEL